MPSTTKKQEDFFRAAAHNAKFARKAGIDQAVAKEFHREDQKKRSKRKRK